MKPTTGDRNTMSFTANIWCFLFCAISLWLPIEQTFGASLESQWRKLPELTVKPESGSGSAVRTLAGGGQWKQSSQSPDYVPVKFIAQFQADGIVYASLGGATVSGTNNFGTCTDIVDTTPGQVNLKLYQTYQFTMWGNDVYSASGNLSATSLQDLFASPAIGQQPQRVYSVYIWVPARNKWEKLCLNNSPDWNLDVCQPMSATFLIQVRPDLGARPVSKPGAQHASGDDQGDDAWTRDEPAIDAQTAPGDGEAVQMSSSKQGDPASVRFQWSAYLGRLWSGGGAGRIRIDELRLSTNVYSPLILSYSSPSADTNEVLVLQDLDNSNCLAQIRTPQALANIDLVYGTALFTTNDLLSVNLLVQQLTNHLDLLSGFLWTNFTAADKQTLQNTNSTTAQLGSVLTSEFNTLIQGAAIYDSNRFAGVALMGRTRRLLIANPSGDSLTRFNRFLLEDAYSGEIARLLSFQFDLSFYVPSQIGAGDALGFYTLAPGASSFVRWRIGLPPGATNQWQLQEIRNGTTNGTLLSYSPSAGTWTLSAGTGTEARIETRAITTSVTAGVTNALEVQQVSSAGGVVSDRTAELYRAFDWGYELVTVTNDPGGANLVTQFVFNTDTNQTANYKKIATVLYPDGFWEQRVYSTYTASDVQSAYAPNGSLIRVIQPWKNSSTNDAPHDCLVTDYAYDINVPGTYQVQKWHGIDLSHGPAGPDDYDWTLSRSTCVTYEEDTSLYVDLCAEAGGVVTERRRLGNLQHYGAAQWTTTFSPYNGRVAGHVYSKEDQVGKFDSYDYQFGAWDPVNHVFTDYTQAGTDRDVRQTILHGVMNPWIDQITTGPSGAAIAAVGMEPFRGTMEVRVIQGGNLAAKELYVYQGNFTNFARIDQIIYQRDCLGHSTNVTRIDPATGQGRVIYQADWKGTSQWPTDLKLSVMDNSGILTAYTYDSLKRVKTQTKQPVAGQVALVTTLSYDSAGRVLTNTVTGGSLSQSAVTLFDLAGRLTQQTTPQGLTTSYSYQNGGQQTTVAESSGATTVLTKYLDRRTAGITGSAVTNQFFDYSLLGNNTGASLCPQNLVTVTLGSSNALRWTASSTDARFEPSGGRRPAFGSTNILSRDYSFFSTEITRIVDSAIDLQNTPPDPYDNYRGRNLETDFTYDSYGQRVGQFVAPPEQPNDWITYSAASNGRINTFTNLYQQDSSGTWFHVSEQWTYPYSNDPTAALVSRTKERITGFTAAGVSETQKFDADTNQTTVTVSVDLPNRKVTTITTVTQSSLSATQVVVNGLLQSESTTTVASPAVHYFDALGRETGIRDSSGNLTQKQYDPVTGQVTATINPQGLRTTLQYYPAGGHAAGLLKSQTGPTGRTTYYDYNDRGQLTYTWGDVPYPEKREYNQFGDQTTLTTYRGGSQWNGSVWPVTTGTGDVTTWYYDEPTGLLTNKTDAASQHVLFDYYNTWLLRTRVWARGVASTNIYRANGDFVRIDYSDGTSVKFTDDDFPYLNRMVKPWVVLDNAGTSELAYDYAGRLRATTYAAGLLAGITVTNHLDPIYGRDLLQVLSSNATPSTIYSAGYGYDSYGRMGSVSSGVYSATYGYVPNSDLLQSTTCKNNGSTVLTTTRTWDYGYRLRSIANVANGATVTSHSYLYDSLDRRIQATLEDGSTWKYNYNDRNELVAAHRYWSDWSPVSGQQYGYDYDTIGNRSDAKWGGDTGGANLRLTTYTANSLNEYTSIATPGYESIIGAALATNGVTVNSGAADRKSEYFHREITVANGGGPVWQNASVTSGGGTTNGGSVFPASSQALTYDADGNLTFDGVWTYEWDPENRLAAMSMTNVAGFANSNRLRLEFVYDFLGRRVSKTVKSWNGTGFASPATTFFAYDGWNSVAALTPSLTAVMTFMWGRDLGGSMDKAGGVGGLLMSSFCGTAQTNCFISYDGTGSVTGLINATGASVAGRFEYSPYGEVLRSTGPLSRSSPFRFSTKFWDQETGLVYYNFRFYSPQVGRWINRDPGAEPNGVNLYSFVFNAPVIHFDTDGRFTFIETMVATAEGLLIDSEAAWVIGEIYMKVTADLAAFSEISGIIITELPGALAMLGYNIASNVAPAAGLIYAATYALLNEHPEEVEAVLNVGSSELFHVGGPPNMANGLEKTLSFRLEAPRFIKETADAYVDFFGAPDSKF